MIRKKSLFSWVFERYHGLQMLLFVMILATIFFRVIPLEMQKRLINSAIAFRKVDMLLLYCGLYICAVVLAGALKYLINVLQGYIGQKILVEMRAQLYDHILKLPLPFFRRTPPGMVIATLTSELSVIGEFMGGAIAVPTINILTLVVFAGYLAFLNPLLAVLSFSIYPIEIFVIPVLQRRFNRLNQHRIDVVRSMSNVIGEAISGMHEIHGNAAYGLENRKLARFNSSLFDDRYRMNTFKFLIKFANNFFQSLGPFILFLLGGYLTIQGELDLGALVAFLSAYEKLYDPWKELMDYYQDYQDSKVRYRQMMEAFDLEPDFEFEPVDGREAYRLKGQIEVRDLSFQAEHQIKLLDQVSLDVKPGEQLGLVGPSGSGKSTLAMVLGQLYSYDSGHVLMDGMELKNLTRLDASCNIGYVAQAPFIFDGSIMDNLLYACESLRQINPQNLRELPTRDEILRALGSVGLSEDILKTGLETSISPDRHTEFAAKLIRIREAFIKRLGKELTDVVDVFDINHFQYYSTVAENITFGYPNIGRYELERLPRNVLFRSFLKETGLLAPLLQLGEQLALETVSLLNELREDPFFFEMSPIPQGEFEQYATIVEYFSRTGGMSQSRADENALLKLALRFVPAVHKMAALPASLEAQIVGARLRFMEMINGEDPEAFTFYRSTEYLYTQSIMSNILFGHPKADYPQAMERIRESVVELLIEERLLDEVMGVGLEFQVGSKGDRLSGGQKQKIAIARVLLKNPIILIMDEATASLDNASQARIQQLIHSEMRGKVTLIAVAHRLEMVRDFDVIAVMKAGKIVEIGQYDELMQKGGLFYELAGGS